MPGTELYLRPCALRDAQAEMRDFLRFFLSGTAPA